MQSAAERSSPPWPTRGLALLRQDWAIVSLTLLTLLALAYRIARQLPLSPEVTGDTESYLAIAAHRPPLYGWLLALHERLFGSLDHLPIVQLVLLAAGLLLYGIEFGRLLRNALAGAFAIMLILFHPAIHDISRAAMTEAVFLALVLAGLGLQFRQARIGSLASLLGASFCFALATATRTTGAVLLPLPLLAALLDNRSQANKALRHALAAGILAGAVLAMAMTANWARHGHFEIGSWVGASILGKGLLLATEEDRPLFPNGTAMVLPEAAAARQRIAAQPDLPSRLQAQMQAYSDLRYPLFLPAAETGWPGWLTADERGRGQLEMALTKELIAHHPANYLRLWLRDWLSLQLYPAYWPAWLGPAVGDRAAFPACHMQGNCWVLDRYDIPARSLLALLAAAAASLAGTLLLLPLALRPVLQRRASPKLTLAWLLAGLAQASLLATSAFEAGLARYATLPHLLGTALLIWMIVEATRRFGVLPHLQAAPGPTPVPPPPRRRP